MASETELQTEFVQKLLCDERINQDQYNFLICNIYDENYQGQDDPDNPSAGMSALNELGLANEFRNFKSMLDRNRQDKEYQISIIKDLINEATTNLTEIQKKSSSIVSEYEEKIKNYDTVKGRLLRFPDNPRFIKEMEEAEAVFAPIRNSYINHTKLINEYQDSLKTWNKCLTEQ